MVPLVPGTLNPFFSNSPFMELNMLAVTPL
jgi:hypothetical protein